MKSPSSCGVTVVINLPDAYSGMLQFTSNTNIFLKSLVGIPKGIVMADQSRVNLVLTNFSDTPVKLRQNLYIAYAEKLVYPVIAEIMESEPNTNKVALPKVTRDEAMRHINIMEIDNYQTTERISTDAPGI